MTIQFRAPDSDGQATGDIGRHATAHAAFAGQSGTEGEIARLVVKASRQHQGAQTFGLAGGEYLFPGTGVQSPVGQKQERT